MRISKEIRSKISQLDDLSREINYYLQTECDDQGTEEFQEVLEELENSISNFQEEQGWI
jgi:phage host-nuclease inhibitor protein Gam